MGHYLVDVLDFEKSKSRFCYDAFETLVKMLKIRILLGMNEYDELQPALEELVYTIKNVPIISRGRVNDEHLILVVALQPMVTYDGSLYLMPYFRYLFENLARHKGIVLESVYTYLKNSHAELIEAEITDMLNAYFSEYYDTDSNEGKLAALPTRREFLTLIRNVYDEEELNKIDAEILALRGEGQ
jgi:hypothetical protein